MGLTSLFRRFAVVCLLPMGGGDDLAFASNGPVG